MSPSDEPTLQLHAQTEREVQSVAAKVKTSCGQESDAARNQQAAATGPVFDLVMEKITRVIAEAENGNEVRRRTSVR